MSRGSRDDLLASLARGDSLHIATHGQFREDNPAFSHLRCSGGALFVGDLDGLRVRSPFVFLSACGTGQVADERGDELQSVAHAFLSSGTRRLVASRWAVDDGATLALVRRFYRAHWKEGPVDPAGAMHSAMIESCDAGLHPFHWGGFSVYEA